MLWKHPEYIKQRTLKTSEIVGRRRADADGCYQFAEIGAVQDEEGNGWVSQNAWEHSESLQEVFSSSLGKKKNLCWVTHLEAMNLFPKRRSFPLTCCVQGCVCPAQLEDVTASLVPGDLAENSSFLCAPAPFPWNLVPSSEPSFCKDLGSLKGIAWFVPA